MLGCTQKQRAQKTHTVQRPTSQGCYLMARAPVHQISHAWLLIQDQLPFGHQTGIETSITFRERSFRSLPARALSSVLLPEPALQRFCLVQALLEAW